MKKRIFAFVGGALGQDVVGYAVSEDGYCLASHVSSNEGWAKHDLGLESNRKHDAYNSHFGASQWEIEWVSDPESHEGMKAAAEIAAARRSAEGKNESL